MTGPLTLTPVPKLKFFIPGTTNVASGAKLFTYAAGTQTKQATYSTPTGTPNTNPIILDANGECVCYVDSSLNYDFWFAPSTDTDPPTNAYWTVSSVGYSSQLNGLAPLNSPVFTGTPQGPTPATGDNSTNLATTQFVQTTFAGFTSLLSGSPTTTTQTAGDYSTKIATTAFVGNEITKAGQMVVFTNSGTWTVPTNVTRAKFRLWGAGGGGGGGTGGGSPGSGGGGGGYAEGWINLGGNTSLAIVIGTPGNGGAIGAAGTAGTNSTIAVLGITAGGGGAGAGNGGTPGAAGTASGLALTLSGGTGGLTQSPSAGLVGAGGPSFGSSISFGNAISPGGGGSGGSGGGATAAAGNGGAAGLCIIEWLAP